jgi:hypothetical protein
MLINGSLLVDLLEFFENKKTMIRPHNLYFNKFSHCGNKKVGFFWELFKSVNSKKLLNFSKISPNC